jgi:predicted permease
MTAAAALGIGAGGLMAAIAAFVATSPALATLMPGGSRSVARSSRTGKVLIGAQSAVSIVLVTHATLLARNVLAIAQAPSGLTTETVLTDMLQPRPGGYRNVNPDTYYPEALRRVQAVPGVRGAAFSQHRPQLGALPATEAVAPAGSPPELQGAAAETTHVSPGFFTTVGITLLQGRDFSLADTGVTPRVVIVSRDLARRLFGDGRGLGERVRIGNRADWQNVEIVGIAADARLFDLRRGNAAIAYTPALQNGAAANYKALVVRAPEAAIPAIQEAIVALGAELPPSLVTLEYRRGRTILQERLMAVVGGSFAALALVLLLAGLYGLLAYLLSLRRKEFGIRLALGADGGRMARALAGDALAVTGFGLAIGLGAALASVRVLRSVLAATSPYDPLSLVIACVLLLLVTMMATVLPARRAARVDPLAELRRD